MNNFDMAGSHNPSEAGIPADENLARLPSTVRYLVERERTLRNTIGYEARGAFKIETENAKNGVPFNGFATPLNEAILELGEVVQIMSDIGTRIYSDRAKEYIEKRLLVEQALLEAMPDHYPDQDIERQENTVDLLIKAQEELK